MATAWPDDPDAVCQRFETLMHRGVEVSIEDAIAGLDEPERSNLLLELILIECRASDDCDAATVRHRYAERFADATDAIDEAIAILGETTEVGQLDGKRLVAPCELSIRRFHAAGGLGEIYIGQHEQLRRELAIKMLKPNLCDDPRSVQQFEFEASVSGRLEHPGIPTVHAIGHTADGQPFFAMRYIEGVGLDRLIRNHHRRYGRDRKSQTRRFRQSMQTRWSSASSGGPANFSDASSASVTASRAGSTIGGGRVTSAGRGGGRGHDVHAASPTDMSLRDLIEILMAVCHTVDYAHTRDIIHCDIKPANIIFGRFGQAVVIDWGLAVDLSVGNAAAAGNDARRNAGSAGSGASGGSDIVGARGTPAFMSPEQAAGIWPPTRGTDIYSIGATLYYILTGTPPRSGDTGTGPGEDIVPVAERSPYVPRELAAICDRATAKSVSDRYSSCQELRDDLERFLTDRETSVHPDSKLLRAARWTRHHNRTVLTSFLALMSIVLLTMLLTAMSAYHIRSQQGELKQANQMRQQEKAFRESGLLMAADFAARTLSNQIELYFQILEKEAVDPDLIDLVQRDPADQIDSGVDDHHPNPQLQRWLDNRIEQSYVNVDTESWFVMNRDGQTVARSPQRINKKRSPSIGRNFAFRDYFHGLGADLHPAVLPDGPMSRPHISAVQVSSVTGNTLITFSVPIVEPADGDEVQTDEKNRVGVLCICVRCGHLSELSVQQPEQQKLLLVESRAYPIPQIRWDAERQKLHVGSNPDWSKGLILHYPRDAEERANAAASTSDQPHDFKSLYLDPALVHAMDQRTETFINQPADSGGDVARVPAKSFNPNDRYRPPNEVAGSDKQVDYLAAYAPVMLPYRMMRDGSHHTGWYVIVQQEMERDSTSVQNEAELGKTADNVVGDFIEPADK